MYNPLSFQQDFFLEYVCHQQLQCIVRIHAQNGIEQCIFQLLFCWLIDNFMYFEVRCGWLLPYIPDGKLKRQSILKL